MATKSKILFIGGTGYIGKFIVEASAKAGHPTSVLVRDSTLSNPGKSNGDLFDHESLVKAIKRVDVVISTVGHAQLVEQGRIIAAIKEAGNVKGDHTNFYIEPSFGVEASELYPDVKYTTVDEYLNQFV
ncbi:hypothetical protein POTOM_015919 [Populus tomentosa]|uniref:NmrA-like domain-containing protein n=1 Tax=Populus tomentosa TaxID=118781 RepID=A0A8X7ZYM4_POPTO|nr:hypothetical protein POTOM_015919 [Populus tomentosa]